MNGDKDTKREVTAWNLGRETGFTWYQPSVRAAPRITWYQPSVRTAPRITWYQPSVRAAHRITWYQPSVRTARNAASFHNDSRLYLGHWHWGSHYREHMWGRGCGKKWLCGQPSRESQLTGRQKYAHGESLPRYEPKLGSGYHVAVGSHLNDLVFKTTLSWSRTQRTAW
jgi:hypothetical protein